MIEIYDSEYDFPIFKCESFTIKEINNFSITIDWTNGTDCDDNIVITSSIPITKKLTIKEVKNDI